MAEARNYPGQEREVFDFYRQNPQASAQLRAPVYEEKVVELIFSRAQVTDQPVSKEALLAEEDLPEGYGESSETASAEAAPAEAAPAKKPRAKKAKKSEAELAPETGEDA
jgi:trigger factor